MKTILRQSGGQTVAGAVALFCLFLPTASAMATVINAKDAEAVTSSTTMTLKRVHVGKKDYVFRLKWDPAANAWKTTGSEPDLGYGWRPEASLPGGGHWSGSAVLGTKLYIVGGAGVGRGANEIDSYDSVANTWSKATTTADLGFLLRAVAVSGRVYIFKTNFYTSGGFIYDPAAKSLLPIVTDPPPPSLEWTSEAAVHAGKVYFFGGSGTGMKRTWEFNPATSTFTQKADLPTGGYASSTAVLNGKIYVIGGNFRNDKIDIYDPSSNTWAATLTFAPLQLFGWETAAPLGKRIVIAAPGGNTFVFDPLNNTLTAQEKIPGGQGEYLTGEGLAGRLYVVGGHNTGPKVESFKPGPGTGAATWHPLLETELSGVAAPDYWSVEEAHRRLVERLEKEFGARSDGEPD